MVTFEVVTAQLLLETRGFPDQPCVKARALGLCANSAGELGSGKALSQGHPALQGSLLAKGPSFLLLMK